MGSFARTRALRVALVTVAFGLVAAACSSAGEDAAPTPTDTTETTTSSSTTTSSPASSTTTTEPPAAEYPPGVVWEQSVVSETRGLTVTSAISGAGRWVVTAYEPHDAGATPIVFTSPDGRDWTRTDLPEATRDTLVYDVVYGPSGFVAVGFAGERCTNGCANGNGVAWVSADGTNWELIEPGAFTGPNEVQPNSIRVIDDIYVAVGYDQGDGIDQVAKVWSSPDGRQWELTAVLDDPDWPLKPPGPILVWDGGYVVTAPVAVCAEPILNSDYGWVYPLSYRQAGAWTSPDGTRWTPLDLGAEGLITPFDDAVCEPDELPQPEETAAAYGQMSTRAGRLFWEGGVADTLLERNADTGKWGPTDATEPQAILDWAGWPPPTITHLTDDLGVVAVALTTDVLSDEIWAPTARSDDLVTWEDHLDATTRFPPLEAEYKGFEASFTATSGEELLVVYQGSTGTVGEEGPVMALVSGTAPIPGS